MMEDYTPTDNTTIQKTIVDHVEHTLARTRLDFKSLHCYQAVAHSVRDRLIEYYNDTYRTFYNEGTKKVYYFSCLLYTSPSPRDLSTSRMPSSA